MIDKDNAKFPYTDVDEDGNIKTMRHFNDIANYNFDGMCAEEKCSKRYTKSIYLTLNGIKIMISLCDKHVEEYAKFAEEYNRSLIARGI